MFLEIEDLSQSLDEHAPYALLCGFHEHRDEEEKILCSHKDATVLTPSYLSRLLTGHPDLCLSWAVSCFDLEVYQKKKIVPPNVSCDHGRRCFCESKACYKKVLGALKGRIWVP